MTVAIHANDFGAAKDLDVGGVHDSMGQITRHALAKIIAADEKEDLARVMRKINSRLTNRAIGQLASSDAGRKSQIIFDPHAAPGLTSGRGVFEHNRV